MTGEGPDVVGPLTKFRQGSGRQKAAVRVPAGENGRQKAVVRVPAGESGRQKAVVRFPARENGRQKACCPGSGNGE